MRESERGAAMARYKKPHVVGWVVAENASGVASICPVGWHMMTSHNPHMMAVSVHPHRFTHGLLLETGDFVLAFPGEDQAAVTLEVGTHSGRDYDKFVKHGLTKIKGKSVQSPVIKECIVNLECKIDGTLETGDHTIFAGRVLHYWAAEDDRRPLLSVDDAGGYDQLLAGHGYQFGAVKR